MASGRRGGAAEGLSVEAAHYYARIYAPARAGCVAALRRAGCGEADAEDIFAATLERIMRKFDDPAGSPYGPAQTVALLKKACLQKLIDERRHRDVLKLVPLEEEAGARAMESAGPAEAAEEREAVEIGREAIASLPDRDRALFYQRHQLELTPQEIVRRNPGLSERTYRKVIWRANARAMRAFEEISSGERCAQMSGERLRRFAAGEEDGEEAAAVRRHLRRCGACRVEAARMRTHLHDVAAGLAAVLAIECAHVGPLGRLLGAWGDATDRAHALGDGLRAGRERLRELALKAATALPGTGGDATAGQVVGVSALKVGSACVAGALAVGCIAAVGVHGVDPFGSSEGRARAHSAKREPQSSPTQPAARAPSTDSSPASEAPAAVGRGSEAPSRAGVKPRRSPVAGSSRPAAPTVESTPSVANEFGGEATGTGTPLPPAPGPSGATGSGTGTEISRSHGTGGNTGDDSSSSSEFGL